ncbi:hypothetical protein B0H14DRAFT_2573422 [Mycena olivaceomarginata]|nr:hypothetical protein B0H14DRAFT_2573422 [Mycena olivaceomarginata]
MSGQRVELTADVEKNNTFGTTHSDRSATKSSGEIGGLRNGPDRSATKSPEESRCLRIGPDRSATKSPEESRCLRVGPCLTFGTTYPMSRADRGRGKEQHIRRIEVLENWSGTVKRDRSTTKSPEESRCLRIGPVSVLAGMWKGTPSLFGGDVERNTKFDEFELTISKEASSNDGAKERSETTPTRKPGSGVQKLDRSNSIKSLPCLIPQPIEFRTWAWSAGKASLAKMWKGTSFWTLDRIAPQLYEPKIFHGTRLFHQGLRLERNTVFGLVLTYGFVPGWVADRIKQLLIPKRQVRGGDAHSHSSALVPVTDAASHTK